MKNLAQYKWWYLVSTIILITLIESIPRITSVAMGSPFRPKLFGNESHPSFVWGFLTLYMFLAFGVFTFFNYSWRDKLLINSQRPAKEWIIIVTGNILLIILFALINLITYKLIYEQPVSNRIVVFFYLKNAAICAMGLLSTYVLYLILRTRIVEIENLKLKRENTEAQLTSLRNQMNPHFLFNTLNSLSSVIRLGEKTESLQFVDKMSEVYRYILESNEHKTIELKRELQFLEAYIFMMDKRFGKKLTLNVMVDNLQNHCMIPPMTLQLLVENAIKHNKITETEPLNVSIYHTHQSIIVENNLQKKRSEDSYGIGLANLQNRFKLLAGRDISIRMENGLFTVELPIIWK